MRLFHEIIELSDGHGIAVAVCRPRGAGPIPDDHADAIRRAGIGATTRQDTLYFTRIDDGNAYIWHLIPSPLRAFERIFQ